MSDIRPAAVTVEDLAAAIAGDADALIRLSTADSTQLADKASRHGVLPLLVDRLTTAVEGHAVSLPLAALCARAQQDLFADMV